MRILLVCCTSIFVFKFSIGNVYSFFLILNSFYDKYKVFQQLITWPTVNKVYNITYEMREGGFT